jgi:formylmethanofuran dehydrogenase subunit E
MASRIPEEVVEYILSFMWKCNVCGIYIEMDTTKQYNSNTMCKDCEDRRLLWILREKLIELGLV